MRRASASTLNTELRRALLALVLLSALTPLGAQNAALASFSVNGQGVGDREFLIGAGDEPFLPSALVRELLDGIARPELLEAISTRERLVSAAELSLVGIQLDFNPDSLKVALRVLPRAALPIDLSRMEEPRQAGGRLVEPEKLSLILGLGLLLEPRYLPSALERPFRPYTELDLSPSLGFFGFVAEASVQAGWREDFFGQVERARILRDFPKAGFRAVGGRLDPRAVSFQASPSLLGVAIYREKSLGGKPPPSPSLSLIEIETPALLSIELNGVKIRRSRLEPGAYRLSDLPLAAGLNDLVIIIEEEGRESRRIQLGLAYEGGLLQKGEFDWYAAAGFDEKDTREGLGSLSASYGLARTATLGANFQAGYGSFLGGLSLVWASPLGSFAAEGGLGGGLGPSAAGLEPAARLFWRLSAPGKPYLPKLGLSFDYRAASFAAPAADSALEGNPALKDLYRFSAQASQALPWKASLSAAVEARFAGWASLDRLYCSLGLFQSLPGSAFFSLSAGMDFDAAWKADPSLSLSLSLNPQDRRSVQYRHDFVDITDSIDLTVPLEGPGENSLSIRTEGFPAVGSQGLRVAAASVRSSLPALELGFSAAYSGYASESAEWNAMASGRSSLVLAGGRAAFVANPGETLVLLAPTASLGGELVELRSSGGSLLAASRGAKTGLGTGIRAYERMGARIEMPESPPELSVFDPEIVLEGGYRSVLVVRAEAARSLTIRGLLLSGEGLPAAGRYGEVYLPSGLFAGVDTFTDEKGEFYCYGLKPGSYTIYWAGGEISSFSLSAMSAGEVDLGEIASVKPESIEEEP